MVLDYVDHNDGWMTCQYGWALEPNPEYEGFTILFSQWLGDDYTAYIDQVVIDTVCPSDVKWSQRPVPHPNLPNTYVGWDEEAHNHQPRMVADDFLCDSNKPVVAIRWWGSLLGWDQNDVPVAQLPDAFYITIWNDVPVDPNDPNTYSHPGQIVWENYCDSYDISFYGWEFDPNNPYDPCDPCDTMLAKFEFYQELDPCDYWYQNIFPMPPIEQIHWLGIMAIYEDEGNEPNFPWGWETREHLYNDDAVRFFGYPQRGTDYTADDFEPIEFQGESWDLSFELLTVKETVSKPPVPHLKWSQPPIEIDPTSRTPEYCGWNEPSHREIISFGCWGPTWPYQCHGDADNMQTGPFRVAIPDLTILKTAMGGSYGNPVIPLYNACADFDRNLVVDHKDLDILKEWFGKSVPGDCPPWVGSVPSTGGLEYWDLFAVCLSRQDVYWNLVDGGAGSLSDPLLSPDPMGTAVIDPNTPLDGVIWGFGGVAWGDNILDSDGNTYSIELKEETDYYLSVVLDTSTTPQHNGYFPSWGTVSEIIVRPWDPDANTWGEPIVPNWVISPFDPDGGTLVTAGASSIVTLAGNNFGDLEYDNQGGMGIWGAAAQLPAAAGYKVDFATEINTWDSYDNIGPKARIASQNVADDFRCLGSMPITSVHWWGSYLGWEDVQPPPVEPEGWRIAFWSNVSAGVHAEHSYPERLLWEIEVPAHRVAMEYVGSDFFPDACTPSDMCFQYHMELLRDERFWQHEFLEQTMDETFWISITALYAFGSPPVDHVWGWKTRPWSWMDDAVTFTLYQEPNESTVLGPERVTVLEYEGESYDVAFELDTDPNWIKWEQAYDSIRHWQHYEDEVSMAYEEVEDINIIRLVADDWPCDHNGAVSAIVWWGSYIGYGYEACQDPGMGWMPLPVKPDYFLLNIWTDVPADSFDPTSYSHPNDIIWEYKAYDYDEVLVGFDKHPHGETNEPVFRYSVRLPDANHFCQDANDGIYWFSAVAVYDQSELNYDWGWTNHEHVYNDDAVAGYIDPASGAWLWQELFDQTQESEDMSFVLFTECMSCSAGEYPAWLDLEKPKCWCYPRQCRGDVDGLQLGPLRVSINDLILFRLAINQMVLPPDGICSDLDHQALGPLRVSINDLMIMRTYINQMLVPECDQPPIITGPYNFWTSP